MGRHFIRPVPEVLDDGALVPRENLSRPPERLTHVLKRETAYRYAAKRGKSDGRFAAGTRVALADGGGTGQCRVIDARGLSVYVTCSALRELRHDE
jgi:hypothetical protein